MIKSEVSLSAILAVTLVCALGASVAQAFDPAVRKPLYDPAMRIADTPHYGTWGFDVTGVDAQAKPGDSFFDYANGAWFARAEIPADKSTFGMVYAVLDRTQEQLRTLIEDAVRAHAAPNTNKGKIGTLYDAFMDEPRIEKLDDKPIRAALDRIHAASTREQMAELMGRAEGGFGASFVHSSVNIDAKDSRRYAVYVAQSGLGLPDRDDYLADAFRAKKAEYRDYIAKMLTMVGWPDAEKRADEIVVLETTIAQASWSRAESRNRDKTYNVATFSMLENQAPSFPWRTWARAAGLPDDSRVIMVQVTAMPKLARIFADTPVDTLKAWQAFRVADSAAPYLSKRFVEAHFEFRDKALQGQLEDRPRWKRGVQLVDSSLGEAVGKEYVARYFPPHSKAVMLDLVAQLRAALQHRIERVAWMSPDTKTKALDKLAALGVKIGYPNKWRDYSSLKIDAIDLVGDVQRSEAFARVYELSHLGKPVDKDEWDLTPQTVNAHYNPTRNEIVFPAAILQSPFFDPKADTAVNFGGIGGIIGHEMTHGFDDQGRKSDGNGDLTEWWTTADATRFDAEAAKYGGQYDTYFVAPGVHVKGAQTMGENIADLGGVLLALDAYHASLHGRPAPVLDGFTGDQRVFFGWAQIWREKTRPDALKQQATSDTHSPARFRVDGPMRNIDAWYAAFDVKPGDKLYLKPEDRAHIW